MSENQTLLLQLQRQNASIQRLLTPGLKPTAGSVPFAGRKFQVAARQMRAIQPDRLNFAHQSDKSSLGAEISQRLQGSGQGLRINPKAVQNKTWDTVERVFHGSTQSKQEAPAAAGEFRQGSIIPRMETFPKPGQSGDDFRQQIQAAPRPKRAEEATPKQAVIAPKSRVFTSVKEISKPPAKPASPSMDEPEPASLSVMRSPPSDPIVEKEPTQFDAAPKNILAALAASKPVTSISQPNTPPTIALTPDANVSIQRETGDSNAFQPAVAPTAPAKPVAQPLQRQESNQPPAKTSTGNPISVSGTSRSQAKAIQRQSSKPLQAIPVQSKAPEPVKPVVISHDAAPAVKSPATNPVKMTGLVQPAAKSQSPTAKPASTLPSIQRDVANDVNPALPAQPAPESRSGIENTAEVPTSQPEKLSHLIQQTVSESSPTADVKAPLLQAKPVQRQPLTSPQAEILKKGLSLQAKSIQRKTQPLLPAPAIKSIIAPKSSKPAPSTFKPAHSSEKTTLIHRAETKGPDAPLAPAAPKTDAARFSNQVSIARLPDKLNVWMDRSSLISRMPLLQKAQALSQPQPISRMVDSEKLHLKNSPAAMLQRQNADLVSSEKYKATAMPTGLPDMAITGPAWQPGSSSAGSSPMTLARMPGSNAPTAPIEKISGALVQRAELDAPTIFRSSNDSGNIATPVLQQPESNTTNQKQPDQFAKDGKKPVDLNALAEEIFPLVKRLLAIEADRSGDGFR